MPAIPRRFGVSRSRRAITLGAVAVAFAVALTGCGLLDTSKPDAGAAAPTPSATATPAASAGTDETPSPTPAPAAPASVTIKAGGSTVSDAKIDIVTPLTVDAGSATLTSVKVTGGDSDVKGSFSDGRTGWTSAADTVLDSGTTYTVKAIAKGGDGQETTKSKTFTTKSMTALGSDITPEAGETVGVGMPIIIRFSAPVLDKAAVEEKLVVESTSEAVGGWYWVSSSEVHYRTQRYWPAGTDVTLRMNLLGVKASPSVIGIKNKVKAFHVGKSQVSKISLKTDHLTYYVNGKVAKVIPVTGGKPGWETRSGIKLVLERRTDVNMRSETIGVADKNSSDYYDLRVKWALRVTWSGEFVHSAPWSVGSQGVANVSHGCVGMNEANMYYLWKSAHRGDPVEVTGSEKKMTNFDNGMGDWNLSWTAWKAGSAL
jgi:lipoprotein-anchoring transpeptidase ErfK/SrfK